MWENTNGFFKGKVRKYKEIIKQLLNSVLVGNEKLLRPRITQTSALIIPHILLEQNRPNNCLLIN